MPKRAPIGLMFAESSSSSSDSDDSDNEGGAKHRLVSPVKNTLSVRTRSQVPSPEKSQSDSMHSLVATMKPDVSSSSAAAKAVTQPTKFYTNPLLADSIVMQPGFEALHELPSEQSRRQKAIIRKKARERTTGGGWFDLPATELTEERERDLQLLQMRDSLDPARFYKNNDRKVLPKYFQVGTVVEHAADFYHSRIPKKQRKRTIVEEVLADQQTIGYQKRKFAELEETRRSTRRGAFSRQTDGHKHKQKQAAAGRDKSSK